MKPEIATLQEPMGNAVYTVESAQVKDQTVAVVGLGSTGLFAIGVAKKLGAKQVIAIGGSSLHRKIAKKMGADVIINRHDQDPIKEVKSLTDGLGVDAVLEMSGAGPALQQALEMVRPVGTVAVLGLPTKPLTIDVSKYIVLKDLTFRGIYGRKIWDTWKTTAKLLKGGLDISPVITHRLKLEDFETGVAAMKAGESGKVIFTL